MKFSIIVLIFIFTGVFSPVVYSLDVMSSESDSIHWTSAPEWKIEGKNYLFESESKDVTAYCKDNLEKTISFPKRISSVQQFFLDGRLIKSVGRDDPHAVEKFYSRPSLDCRIVSLGETLKWRIVTLNRLYASEVPPPRIIDGFDILRFIDEESFSYVATSLVALILIGLFPIGRKIGTSVKYPMLISTFFLLVYLVFGWSDLSRFLFTTISRIYVGLSFGLYFGIFGIMWVLFNFGYLSKKLLFVFLASFVIQMIGSTYFFVQDDIELLQNLVHTLLTPVVFVGFFAVLKLMNAQERKLALLGLAILTITGANDFLIVVSAYDGPNLFGLGLLGAIPFWISFIQSEIRSKSEFEDIQKLNALSNQVAHDIRSPLTALDIGIQDLKKTVPERVRILELAVKRIKDITNDLGVKRQAPNRNLSSNTEKPHSSFPSESIYLLPMIAEIVSEKRLQYKGRSGVNLSFEEKREAYDIFVKGKGSDLERALSNLIDNSFEAIRQSGNIEISIEKQKGFALIRIVDTGKGLDAAALKRIGNKGFTRGKSEGSGLGFWFAKETAKSCGGSIEIESMVSSGTIVTLNIPMAETPKWFCSNLNVKPGSRIAILDDDQSMHSAWKDLLVDKNVNVASFLDIESLVQSNEYYDIYFVDYQLGSVKRTGLDFIRNQKVVERSFLVTSMFTEKHVREEAEDLAVKIIPKPYIGFLV
ncbi:MAG: ATP-binding protein [Bdellovibrionales bacterium]|nr:ATP-binding protein [Bdellovibrionales bacterium]